MFVIICKDNLELETLQAGPSRCLCSGYPALERCFLWFSVARLTPLPSSLQGRARLSNSPHSCGAVELFCLLKKLNWRPSALTDSKAQLMARATRQPLLFAGCCPTSGSAGSPAGATAAASLSINKSELGRAMERQELCRAVKGDKAKANGLKQERKTIQDEKILTARSVRKHPQELLEWLFLLWEDQGKEGEEATASSPRNKQTHSRNTNHYRKTSSCSTEGEVVPSPRPGQKSVILSAVQKFSSHFYVCAKLTCHK